MRLCSAVVVVLIFFVFAPISFGEQVSLHSNTDTPEVLFKSVNFPKNSISFMHEPRGFVVSIDSRIFFDGTDDKIKKSSLGLLNNIGEIINKSQEKCAIESYVFDSDASHSVYKNDWELAVARANNIAKYLMIYTKVPTENITSIGFGKFVPQNQ